MIRILLKLTEEELTILLRLQLNSVEVIFSQHARYGHGDYWVDVLIKNKNYFVSEYKNFSEWREFRYSEESNKVLEYLHDTYLSYIKDFEDSIEKYLLSRKQ